MLSAAEEFNRHWEFVHMMTGDFASSVPDAHWEFSPHPRFAPFCKQLRHVICVRGLYNETLETGRADWSLKHTHYTGDLTRQALLQALTDKHEATLTILGEIESRGGGRVVEFVGRRLHLGEFALVIVQHESLHQGQWSLYAALAGFETPASWRVNLGALGVHGNRFAHGHGDPDRLPESGPHHQARYHRQDSARWAPLAPRVRRYAWGS